MMCWSTWQFGIVLNVRPPFVLRKSETPPATRRSEFVGSTQIALSYQPWVDRWFESLTLEYVMPPSTLFQICPLVSSSEA
jgi:hypothetical protein